MAVSLNFVHFKLSYFCDTEVSCSSDCYQPSASAWEGTWIGLMATSQPLLAGDEKLEIGSASNPEAFCIWSLSEHT